MSVRVLSKVVICIIALFVCCASGPAQTASSTLPLSPPALDFDDHDIGTTTYRTLAATNKADGLQNFSIRISGPNPGDTPGDFSSNSTCLGKIPPGGSCEIRVSFSPVPIGNVNGGVEARRATLTVTNDKGEHSDVLLVGRAFQNLTVSPSVLEFEGQVGNASGATRTVQVTNYTSAAVNSIVVTATGDFTENHAGCATPITPGGSCAISVTYSPKQAGETRGALTITTNSSSLGRLPKLVSLVGVGLKGCKVPRFSLKDPGSRLVLIIIGLYFLGLVLVRWHMIAKPARAQLVAEIETVRARAVAETAGLGDSRELNGRLARIHFLLDRAIYPFKYKSFPINSAAEGRREPALPTSPPWYPLATRIFNALFWTRGQELAGWTLSNEAELQLVALLPLESLRARLETAEQQLRAINTPQTLALADQVRESLASGEALIIERARHLLQQLQLLLKPLSLPDVARQIWLADLQQRLLNSLQQFRDWQQKNGSPAGTLEDCKSRIRVLLAGAPVYAGLAADLAKVPNLGNNPDPSKNLLTQITPFLTQLVTAIHAVQAQLSDPNLTLVACNNSLSSLTALGNDAGKLIDQLKSAAAADQAKSYLALLELCKSHGVLVDLMTQASTPSQGVTLLRDVLTSLQEQSELVRKINQAGDTGGAPGLESCRDLVFQLAAVPPLASGLLSRIDALVGEAPAPLARWRALLVEALNPIYEYRENDFYQVVSWHNKMIWLVACALLFMFALAVTLGNAVLLLLGAVGGLLSRLTRMTTDADTGADSGATWGSLFLSPLTGALSAWGGILLIILGLKLNIFGSALNLDWCNPYEPVALGIALLFGFLERLFDSVTGQLQDKLLKPAPASPGPGAAASAPTPAPAAPARAASSPTPVASAPEITSVSASNASAGDQMQLMVRGANFQPGAIATVTRETGEVIPTKLNFRDATAVIVTFTLSGATPFAATLTIANPDKRLATAKLNVAAPV
jgi:hypothetical protein